jgi:hypothetical protein
MDAPLISITCDTTEFDRWADYVMSSIISSVMEGTEKGNDILLADAKRGHGPSAHAIGRFRTRTGNLIDNMEVIPPKNFGTFIGGGIYAVPKYAPRIEEYGEGYFKPALKSETVHRKIVDAMLWSLRRGLVRKV